MKLFVGLGNPGAEYAFNRHNVGFMAADAIAASYGFSAWRHRFSGLLAEGRLGGEKVLILKPQTYMNESGRAAGEAMRFYKLDERDVIVFHDELDLAPGKLRVKVGGSGAGHNGLKSLTAHLGNDYTRVRIGIGHPGHRERVVGYVMHDFAKADYDWLEPLLGAIVAAAPDLADGANDKFQSLVAHHSRAEAEPAAKDDRAKTPSAKTPSAKTPSAKTPSAKAQSAKAQSAKAQSAKAPKTEPAPAKTGGKPERTGPLASMLRRWLDT